MFKRGDVVQHTKHKWIGVVESFNSMVETLFGQWVGSVIWFEGEGCTLGISDGKDYSDVDLIKIDGYEFEAALYLGDTAKALELYRAEQQRTADWQKYFQPLFDQYGAERMAWIAGSIAGMVATGQFNPAAAIRHWQRPQAVLVGPQTDLESALLVDLKAHAQLHIPMLDDVRSEIKRRIQTDAQLANEYRYVLNNWEVFDEPGMDLLKFAALAMHGWIENAKFADELGGMKEWKQSGLRLVIARQRFDIYTGRLTDAEWQAVLDRCNEATRTSFETDVYWNELSKYEKIAQRGKDALLEAVRKAHADEP